MRVREVLCIKIFIQLRRSLEHKYYRQPTTEVENLGYFVKGLKIFPKEKESVLDLSLNEDYFGREKKKGSSAFDHMFLFSLRKT